MYVIIRFGSYIENGAAPGGGRCPGATVATQTLSRVDVSLVLPQVFQAISTKPHVSNGKTTHFACYSSHFQDLKRDSTASEAVLSEALTNLNS